MGSLLGSSIGLALAPAISYAIPIEKVFKFFVPLVPDRADKTCTPVAPGSEETNCGWGGLYLSFDVKIPVENIKLVLDPVLAACVDVAPVPVDEHKLAPSPTESFIWRCARSYQLDSFKHPGLNVTVTVTYDSGSPAPELVLDALGADPMETFWWQKQTNADANGTLIFRGDTDPAKLAAFAAPEPGVFALLAIGLAGLGFGRRRLNKA